MSLTSQTKRSLIAAAHSLRPIIIIGNQGLSDSVITEIERALFDHELIKVRILGAEDKTAKQRMAEELASKINGYCLKIIGHILILYRKRDKKKPS